MRKLFLCSLLLIISTLVGYTQKGIIKGIVIDAQTKESRIGATVIIKGTTLGSTTNFDGNFTIQNLEPAFDTVVVSFISYDSQEFLVEVKAYEAVILNVELLPATLEIDGVEIVAKASRESEAMMLIDQRNAEGISEGISSTRMSNLGVSDAASATSKISGVTKNEGNGNVYIRGLGDRYLITTMNGLPIPSDNVDKKNIDLNLFSTDIIGNVGINKTFTVETYGDQSSGAVNIGSKTYSERIEIEASTSSSTNIFAEGIWQDFKTTQNYNDVKFGFYTQPYTTVDAITKQSWNPEPKSYPLGRGLSLLGGTKFELFSNDISIFATIAHSNDIEYRNGIYRKYRSNILDNSFSDAETYTTEVNTTGLLNIEYDFDSDNSIKFNSMLIFKTIDELYEQGRNAEGYVFDQDPQEEGAFVRDQNLKQTQIYINQLLGTHKTGEKNQLNWAAGYNYVFADEPNRIRNEVNILDENTVQFAHVGDFQQRKSSQKITDSEINGNLKDELRFVDEEGKVLKLNFGGSFRMKQRDFSSLFVGVRAKGIQTSSIDNLDEALLNESLYNTGNLIIKDRKPDLYNATLNVYGGFASFGFELQNLSGSLGVRYEMDNIEIDWDVANYVGRKGNISNSYNNVLPALNLKYQLTKKSALRLAASKTITLPEFKELSPFEYVSPTGRVTKGNPDLVYSQNYNFDLKWEMFPNNNELISLSGFYKLINDPINLAQTRGSSGNFIYENTGDKANVYGVEFETRLNVVTSEQTGRPKLDLIVNATKMWFNQDLLEEFQYNNKKETDLQGASGLILNGALSFSNNKENDFSATISGNYSSDKILALGAPEDFENSDILFNNEIIEKGFATVDLIINKAISDRISLKLSGKNLLNPNIKQTQEIKPISGVASTEVVSSYKKGVSFSLSVKINLN